MIQADQVYDVGVSQAHINLFSRFLVYLAILALSPIFSQDILQTRISGKKEDAEWQYQYCHHIIIENNSNNNNITNSEWQ